MPSTRWRPTRWQHRQHIVDAYILTAAPVLALCFIRHHFTFASTRCPRFREPHACDFEPVFDYPLADRSGESSTHKLDHVGEGEAVRLHDGFRHAERAAAGDQLQHAMAVGLRLAVAAAGGAAGAGGMVRDGKLCHHRMTMAAASARKSRVWTPVWMAARNL